jgi:hypothetical protein
MRNVTFLTPVPSREYPQLETGDSVPRKEREIFINNDAGAKYIGIRRWTMDDESIGRKIDDRYDGSQEDTIRSMLSEFYSRKMTATAILVWGIGVLFLAAAVYSAVAFFRTAETGHQIMCATIFISSFFGVGLMKVFAWQMLHKNSIKREIKRLELQVAQLAASLNKRTP